jgi:sulfur relay (sulfurtransferase) DsrC/TusE family protein
MALYKRNNTWWIIINHLGKRVQKSTGTSIKKEAQQFHDKLKADLWKINFLKEKPKRSWQEAVVRWLAEAQHKRSLVNDIANLKWLDKYLNGYALCEITRDIVDNISSSKLQEGVKPATVNRLLELIRSILRKAEREWDWLDRAPTIRMLKEENHRIQWLTREEALCLLNELPNHIAAMAAFTLATGLRKSNVTQLQ